MVIALWLPAALATVACLGAALVVLLRFRPRTPARAGVGAGVGIEAETGLTVIVPIRGVDANSESNLDTLLDSDVPGPVEYLIAMESRDDPAYAVAERVRARHPRAAASIVVTGPADGRMGKQHNLAVAARGARYATIASMDADVRVDPDTLSVGLGHLAEPDVGVAYFLPRYRGPGPAGGRLVALYSNYYYQLNMAALALSGNAPFITGGLWLLSGEARQRIGGIDQFGTTVSDDAAIGKAVVAAGLRTVLIPRTVSMAEEPLNLVGGFRHVVKWLTLLRATGLPTYLGIALSWHPILWAAVALAATLVLSGPRAAALVAFGVAVAVRLGGALVLHARVYGWRGATAVGWLPLYELIAVPALYARGLFSRHIIWRGTRYHIGRDGQIRGATTLSEPS